MENKTLNASGGIRSHLKGYLKEQAIPIGVLLCMIVIGSLLTPMFLTSLNLQNLFIQQSSNMVAALGMFVAILSGGIDLRIGCGHGYMRTLSVCNEACKQRQGQQTG